MVHSSQQLFDIKHYLLLTGAGPAAALEYLVVVRSFISKHIIHADSLRIEILTISRETEN